MTNQKLTADDILNEYITAKAILKEVQERLDDYHAVMSNCERLASEYANARDKEIQMAKAAKLLKPRSMSDMMFARLEAIKLQLNTATEELLQMTKSSELPSQTADSECKPETYSIWREAFKNVDGKIESENSTELFVWAPVNIKTDEVEVEEIQVYDDELNDLEEGWEWRRFRLVKATV